MRITDSMMVASTVRNINNAATRLSQANEQMSSQQKISLASDDPVIATKTIKYRTYVAQVEQYQSNAAAATSWQSTTDSAMGDIEDVIKKLQEDVTGAADGTKTADDLADYKADVESLRDQVIQDLNTSYAGRYVFGGYSTSEAPYKLTTASFLGTVTSDTGGQTYDAANIGVGAKLGEGTYHIGVSVSGGSYTYTLENASTSETLSTVTTTSATDSITFTASDGSTLAVLKPPATGSAGGDGLTFTAVAGDAVTFKGKYLSVCTTDADAAASFYMANSGDIYESSSSVGVVNVTSGTTAYTSSDISVSDNMPAGEYGLSVSYDAGTGYTYTLKNKTTGVTYPQETSSTNTGEVTFTTGSGETLTLTPPAGGSADGDTFAFTVRSDEAIQYNIGFDASVTVNTEGQDVAGEGDNNLFNTFAKVLAALDGSTGFTTVNPEGTTSSTIANIDDLLTNVSDDQSRVLNSEAALGARMKYVDNVTDRLADEKTNYTTLLSDTIDVDTAEATTEQSTAEYVYEASLSVGAKAISKSLVDYIA